MKLRVQALLLAGPLALAACAAGLPHPTSDDAARANERWPSATLGDLGRGRELYVRSCAGCHSLKAPDEVPPGQWESEVAEMRQRHGVALNDAEADAIVRYLWSVGSRLRAERGPKHGARR